MNPAYRKPLLWGTGLIAGGALAILAVRHFGSETALPVAVPAAAPAAAADAAAQPLPASEDTPPWMQSGTAAGGNAAAQRAAVAAPASVADIGRSLADIRQKSDHNVRMADDLLAQLDLLEKSGKTPPDVRLDALRNNLLIAKRAQSLAVELAESTQKQDSPAQRQRNADILAELQQLQGQLRYDVTPNGLPAAPVRTQ